ncbi:hypothetical protein B0H19DRAFT_842187, partial [Mycena capillaripes]
ISSKLARNFLAIPRTMERFCSHTRHLCHGSRASLKSQTITQAMLTKMWIKDGLL